MRFFLPFLIILLVFGACQTDSKKPVHKDKPAPLDTTSTAEPTVPLPSGLSFSFYSFKDENCDLKSLEGVDEDWCNTREVSVLNISLKDARISRKINAQICKEITGKLGNLQSIKNFVTEIKTLTNEDSLDEYLHDEYTCTFIDSSNTYISVGVYSYFYSMGAAHGLPEYKVMNFDLKSGDRIMLSDVFKYGYRARLKAIAKRRFIEQNGNEGWWFIYGDQPFDLPEVFSINQKGITFTYQPYEIGPYAAGTPVVFISKKEIKFLLKENPYLF